MSELLPAPDPAGVADISAAGVNKLLALPEHERFHLGKLLLDSVRENFTSLEEVERQDREEIHRRIRALENGEMKLLDWRESLDRIESELREKHVNDSPH